MAIQIVQVRIVAMYYYELIVAFTAGLILPTAYAGVPSIQSLGSVTVLSDNDLAGLSPAYLVLKTKLTDPGNTTTQTAGALLLSSATYAEASQRCASLDEKLLSPSSSDFVDGLNNALSYQAYLDPGNNPLEYWISSSSPKGDKCSVVTTNGKIIKKPCNKTAQVLCTNSGPRTVLTTNETDPRSDLRISVKSGSQSIIGFRNFYTWQFRGIRFAPKPERFTLSALYKGSGTVEATKYGPGCIQAPDARWPEVSEDCLFLNVWTPYLPSNNAAPKKLKAVMFWIYGGGNLGGAGSDPEKEGGNLASRGDVVVVSFNYRVGTLGFLAFDDGVHTGNYAISDMLNALRWVQKNIKNFGGDPKRVTIWGESAGAVNVRTLLAVPQAEKEGLFQGAILQSGTGEEIGLESKAAQWEVPSVLYSELTTKIIAESGCADAASAIACLRSYDAMKWATEAGRTQAHFASRDNKLIFTRALPLAGPLAHRHNIPILLGTNRDEWSYLLATPTTNFSANLQIISPAIQRDVTHLINSSVSPETLPSWPSLTKAEKEAAVFNATNQVVTGVYFTCLTNAFQYSASKNKAFSATYGFEFNRTYSPARFSGTARPICGRDVASPDKEEYYKCHAGEVPFTFGNILQQEGWPDRDGTDTPFARLTVDYWSAFARTGTPQPEDGYLEARRYTDSREKMAEAGTWNSNAKDIMRLQWTGIGRKSIDDNTVCAEMGLGKDFYESYDYSS